MSMTMTMTVTIQYHFQFGSHPEFLRLAEPWLRKHTVIALRKLCEDSMLYPTCYALQGVEDVSHKGGGGFCDIFQGSYEGQALCLKVVRLYKKSKINELLKVGDHFLSTLSRTYRLIL